MLPGTFMSKIAYLTIVGISDYLHVTQNGFSLISQQVVRIQRVQNSHRRPEKVFDTMIPAAMPSVMTDIKRLEALRSRRVNDFGRSLVIIK